MMSDLKQSIAKLKEAINSSQDIPKTILPEYQYHYSLPDFSSMLADPIEIDEENTFAYQMQQQTNQIIEKSNEQIKLLIEQNQYLESNYKKLEELYILKDKELQDAKKAEKQAKIYNIVMLILTIISMLITVADRVIPNASGGVSQSEIQLQNSAVSD